MSAETLRFLIALGGLVPAAAVFVLAGWPWGAVGAAAMALVAFRVADRVFARRATLEERRRDLRHRVDTND